MEQQVYRKVTSADGNSFRFYANFKENTLELVLFRNNCSWKSLISSDELSSSANQHQKNQKDYVSQLFDFLKNESSEVTISFTNEDFTVTRSLGKNVKVKFFVNKPEKVDFAAETEDLLDRFYLHSRSNCERLEALQKQVVDLDSLNRNYEAQINEIVAQKTEADEELYNKFVLVLNEKKMQIQHLTELLQAFKSGRSTETESVPRKKGSRLLKKGPAVKETISESEEDSTSSYQTDEKDSAQDDNEDNVKDLDEPCTSAQALGLFKEELEEDKDDFILPKRVKYADEQVKCTVTRQSEVIEEVQQSQSEETTRPKKEIPSIDFNTQDLLDMI